MCVLFIENTVYYLSHDLDLGVYYNWLPLKLEEPPGFYIVLLLHLIIDLTCPCWV